RGEGPCSRILRRQGVSMRILGKSLLVFIGAAAACSASTGTRIFGTGGETGAEATGGPSSTATGTGNSGQGGNVTFNPAGGGTGTGIPCTVTDMNADMDGDGWTPAEGDCNDCDPNVNPGAIDVQHVPDGGMPYWGDEDCDGKAGSVPGPCDTGLAVDDSNPVN